MADKEQPSKAPPEIGPYVFPIVLAALGMWCLYDGFLTTSEKMLEYQLFNRIAGIGMTGWAVVDFIRTKKREKSNKQEQPTQLDEGDDQ